MIAMHAMMMTMYGPGKLMLNTNTLGLQTIESILEDAGVVLPRAARQ